MEKTIVVWHDCDRCITKSLINYLNWTYLTRHFVTILNVIHLDEVIKASYNESDLIKILEECEAVVYSCSSFHDIVASDKEWEIIKNKHWYAVSSDNEQPTAFSLFSLKNITFLDRGTLIKLMENVRKARSRA